jgi:hypothetical protein
MKLGRGAKVAWFALAVYVIFLFALLAWAGDIPAALLAAGSNLLVFGGLIWLCTGGFTALKAGYRGSSQQAMGPVSDADVLCTQCGTMVRQGRIGSPSIVAAFFLALFFVIPAVFYWIYRSATSYWGCPRCFSKAIIPLNSPRAVSILAAMNAKPGIDAATQI